jgi:hypothetical protein
MGMLQQWGQFEPCDAEEIAWAISEVMLLNPPQDTAKNPFNEEISAYIEYMNKEEGLVPASRYFETKWGIRSSINQGPI